MKMKAFEEQKKYLENIKLKFSISCSSYIKNAITYHFNEHANSYKIIDNSLNALPTHKIIFDVLIKFKGLIPWLYKSCVYYNQPKNYYEDVKNVSESALLRVSQKLTVLILDIY